MSPSRTHAVIASLFPVNVVSGVASLPAGREGLRAILQALTVTRGAEVGVWKGQHAELLCAALPGLQFLAVDPWQVYDGYREQKNNAALMQAAFEEAQRRLAPRGATFLRMPSVAAAAQVPDRSLDFVYIDGNHLARYVTEDLTAWAPKVCPGGLVAGHDYTTNPWKSFIQVKPAVDAFVAARKIAPLYVLAGDKTPSFFWVAN